MNTREKLLIELLRKKCTTREELSSTLNVARSTLTYVVSRLQREGIVVVEKIRSGRGRPKEVISLNPEVWNVLGIKVGREEVIGLLMNARFEPIKVLKRSVSHASRNRHGYESLIRDVLRGFLRERPIAVGFSISGVLEKGVVVESPMLRIEGLDVSRLVRDVMGNVMITVMNDVEALAVYENMVHGGKRFLVVNYGTGIGASLYANGVVRAESRTIFQIGHTVVDPDGEECYCGQRGCLETVASDYANLKRFTGMNFTIKEFVEFEHERFEAELSRMRELSRSGRKMIDVYGKSIETLSLVIGNLIRILEPEKVVFYGEGISDWMVDEMRNSIKRIFKSSTNLECRCEELDAFEKGSVFMATMDFVRRNFSDSRIQPRSSERSSNLSSRTDPR